MNKLEFPEYDFDTLARIRQARTEDGYLTIHAAYKLIDAMNSRDLLEGYARMAEYLLETGRLKTDRTDLCRTCGHRGNCVFGAAAGHGMVFRCGEYTLDAEIRRRVDERLDKS